MRTLEQRLSYERLELIPAQSKNQGFGRQAIQSATNRLGQWLAKHLFFSSGPMIWETTTSQGATLWRVRDPHTDTVSTFSSESDVRVWLEQRYYHG